MACVTLKRPLDLDPLEALHSPNRPATKRPRCTPLKGADRDAMLFSQMAMSSPSSQSAFRESPLSPSEIANQLRDELKRMRRRRQVASSVSEQLCSRLSRHSPSPPLGSSGCEVMMDSSDQQHHLTAPSSSATAPPSRAAHRNLSADKPVFTLKQMSLICERMCQERTEKVRAEYDQILQQKLSEQYDAFVKFIDHQIEQRFNQSQLPSYLS